MIPVSSGVDVDRLGDRPSAPLDFRPKEAARIAARLREGPGPLGGFEHSAVAALPEPARRWLTHAIEPGTPLYRRAELTMRGEIKLGERWHRFVAAQVIAPDTGFVWAARTHVAGLPVVGYDAYADGAGTMRWHLLGLPVQSQAGSEPTLSAAGRLAAENVLVPTSLVAATWRHDVRPDTAGYYHHTRGPLTQAHVSVKVGPDGQLQSAAMWRWGMRARHSFGLHRFTVDFDRERRFGRVVVPDGIRASWPDGPGEFFRAQIDSMTFA